jgi:hypothetical protein
MTLEGGRDDGFRIAPRVEFVLCLSVITLRIMCIIGILFWLADAVSAGRPWPWPQIVHR